MTFIVLTAYRPDQLINSVTSSGLEQFLKMLKGKNIKKYKEHNLLLQRSFHALFTVYP